MEEKTKLKTAIYLDSIRTPVKPIPGYHPWVVLRNYDELIKYISLIGVPDFISWSHDLHEEHKEDYAIQVSKMGWQSPDYKSYKNPTGLDAAQWLSHFITVNKIPFFPKGSCHCSNPVGSHNIQSYINGFKKHMGWDQDIYIGKHEFIVEEHE